MPLPHCLFVVIFSYFIISEVYSQEQYIDNPTKPKRECWTIRGKDVNAFRLLNGYLNFRVKGLSAQLSFFSVVGSNSPAPTFMINLGSSNNNSVSALHRYKNKYHVFKTPSIIKYAVYSGFWVHWDRHGNFAVGKEGEVLPFMALKDFEADKHVKITQLTVLPAPMISQNAKWLIQVPEDDCQMADGNCDMKDITLPDDYKEFCEYLQMPLKQVSYSNGLNVCDGKFIEFLTPVDGNPSKFKYQEVKDVFNFGIMTEKHAELVFLEDLESEPVFTIVLAANEAPKTSSLWVNGAERLIYDTPGIINNYMHNYFWVTWDYQGHIAMGHANHTIPFMVTSKDFSSLIRYVAFTTYTPGSYVVEASNTSNPPFSTTWKETSHGKLVECAFVGGYLCDGDCEFNTDLFCSNTAPANSEPVYVVRSPHHYGIYPGHLPSLEKNSYIVLENEERKKDFYQVLSSTNLIWVRLKPRDVPLALPAGKTLDGEPLYVCRSKIEKSCLTGYVDTKGLHCIIAFNGKVFRMTKYDTLACVNADKCPKESSR